MTAKIKNLGLKILSGIFALAILIGSGYGVVANRSNNDTGFSALVLANAEALAGDEKPDPSRWGRGNVMLDCNFVFEHRTGCFLICHVCRGRWDAVIPSIMLSNYYRFAGASGQCYCGANFNN